MTGTYSGQWRASILVSLGVILGCFGLAVITTYPLVYEISSHLVGVSEMHDSAIFAWNNWWIRHALVGLHGHAPYLTDYVLVPFPVDLRLHPLGLLYGLVSIPLLSFLSPLALVNLQILATPVLNGYSVFRLVRKWAARDSVAALCGLAIAASPAINFHLAKGRPSCAALWAVALSLLFLIQLIEAPGLWNCVGLAGSLLALLLIDQQMTLFGLVIFSLYLIWTFIAHPRSILDRRLWLSLSAIAVVVSYPIRLLYVRPFLQTSGYSAPDPSEALFFSVSPSQLVAPHQLWLRYGALLPLGFVASLLVAPSERRARFPIFAGLVCVALTLGPQMHGTDIPLPFGLLRMLPGFGQFRTPYRFQIPAALAMAAALAAALTAVLARLERGSSRQRFPRIVLGAVLLLIVGDATASRVVRGFATHLVADEPIYRRIAKTPGDFLVLEVPFGVQSGTDHIGRGDDLMFHQTVHAKRMINGFLGRVPLVAFDYYRKSQALLFLGDEPFRSEDLVADFNSKLRSLDVGFIVVHPEMLSADRSGAVLSFLRERRDLTEISTGTRSLAFRVRGDLPALE